MKTTIIKVHEKDLWYSDRSQIEGRTAVVHGGAIYPDGSEFLTLTFDPPLSVNGRRMEPYMNLRCYHNE